MTEKTPADRPIRVLLVDDDPEEHKLMEGILSIVKGDFRLSWVPSYRDGLAALSRAEHDVCLLDYRLNEEKNGVDLLKEATLRGCRIPIILLTGVWDSTVDHEALQAGAADYLIKGQFGPDVLERSLRYAVERRRLEGMFLQAEKLSAMGLLAAGVAHDLNNPLMIILGSCDSGRAGGGKAAAAAFNAIEAAAKRCEALVRDLLEFSRKEESPPQDFDLGVCAAAALSLIEPQARIQGVEVVRDFVGALPLVHGHKNEIEQVLINLANNALDAMPKGGKLAMRATAATRGGRAFVELRVADTGAGIPKELQARVFEAFFTTKPPGKGTGLGLALATEIVGRHGGSIALSSEPGKGCVFTIALPGAGEAR